jgi:CheY-like chemotaxis protein
MMSLTWRCFSASSFGGILRADRFTMEFAQSAPMALQRISNERDRSLILILSDINMPGMSGLELLPKAKAARPDVPIIMISAYGDAVTKRKALDGGAEALLSKPIDFATLRRLRRCVLPQRCEPPKTLSTSQHPP